MYIKNCLKCSLFLLAGGVGLSAQAQETAATIPASFEGTYELTFDFANAGSPVELGTETTFVIGAGGLLCVDNVVLQDPVFRRGNTAEAIWVDSSTELEYAISDLNGSFNEVNLLSTSGAFHGQYTGSKTSDATDCSAGPGAPSLSVSETAVLDLAETLYPGTFGQGGELGFAQGYVFRFYQRGKVYVGFKDDGVYLLGGVFGKSITLRGAVDTVLGQLQATHDKRQISNPPSIDLEGDYTLTITGTYSNSLINLELPAIVLEEVPAPDPDDEEAILKPLVDALEDSADIDASSATVVIVSNSENSLILDLSVDAEVTGLGMVTYDLHYEYVKAGS